MCDSFVPSSRPAKFSLIDDKYEFHIIMDKIKKIIPKSGMKKRRSNKPSTADKTHERSKRRALVPYSDSSRPPSSDEDEEVEVVEEDEEDDEEDDEVRKKTAFLVFSRISKKKFFKEQKALKKLFLGFRVLLFEREKRERKREAKKLSSFFTRLYKKKDFSTK